MPVQTTGLFLVPNLPAAPVPDLTLVVTSTDPGAGGTVIFTVNQAVGSAKRSVLTGTLAVPPGGAVRADLNASFLEGSLVEVNLSLSSDALTPSVTVFTEVPGTPPLTALFVPASEFAEVNGVTPLG